MKKIFIFSLLFGLAWSSTLSEIRSGGVVRIGVGDDLPPFSMLNGDKFNGFEVQLAQELGKRIFGNKGGKVEFVGMGSKDRIPALENNKVDMVVRTMTITNKRKKHVDFSTPYLYADLALLTNKKDNIKKLSDLQGKKIIAKKGTSSLAKLQKKGTHEIVLCESNKDCYDKLKNGEGSAYLTSNTILLGFTVGDPSVELGVKRFGKSGYVGVGVKKGNKELLSFIDSQIVELSKEGFFKKAFNEQLDPYYKGAISKRYFLLDELYSSLSAL